MVIAWTDSFGRRRLQVIVPVRNESSAWLEVSKRHSRYRLMSADQELARGTFEALPPLLEPGGTGYLVVTREDPSDGRGSLTVKTSIVAVPATEPDMTLSVTGLALDAAIGGGMRASGLVHNDGPHDTGPLTVGAVALAEDGRPLGIVLDMHDIVRIAPGDSQTFRTDVAAGAPAVRATAVETVIAVAFGSGP